MTERLGTRQGFILEVFNDGSTDLAKGLFVQWTESNDSASLSQAVEFIGGGGVSIAGSFDPVSPAEPSLKVIIAGANDQQAIGVTLGVIKTKTRGQIMVQGLCQIQSDGGDDDDAGVIIGSDANGRSTAGATEQVGMSLEDAAGHGDAGDLCWCVINCWSVETAGFGGEEIS